MKVLLCYLLTSINILLINFSFISQSRIVNISSLIVQTDNRQIIWSNRITNSWNLSVNISYQLFRIEIEFDYSILRFFVFQSCGKHDKLVCKSFEIITPSWRLIESAHNRRDVERWRSRWSLENYREILCFAFGFAPAVRLKEWIRNTESHGELELRHLAIYTSLFLCGWKLWSNYRITWTWSLC